MKNGIKIFSAAVIAAAILIHNASAQSASAALSENVATAFSTSAIANVADAQKKKNSLSNTRSRAVKDFQKSFKGVTSEQWSKLDDGYIASFTTDSVQTMVAYNNKGIWHHTIRSYSEKKLPGKIKDIVKSVYYNYTIIHAAEIYFDNEPVYIIYIQDETHVKTIGIYDGEMREVQL